MGPHYRNQEIHEDELHLLFNLVPEKANRYVTVNQNGNTIPSTLHILLHL